MPDLFLTNSKEKPVFHWSFKEYGWITSALNTNTDIVVTTGRVYIYNRIHYKQFDCKTSFCFGACWCACIRKWWVGPKRLERSSSFLTLPFLLSFSTEVALNPPLWYDPHHLPVKCPCFETCCGWCTLCMTCQDRSGVVCDKSHCGCIPRRAGPRAQLWMSWRHRFNGIQRDLMSSVRPYVLPDVTFDMDLWEFLGCGAPQLQDDGGEDRYENYNMVEMLRKIMGVIQDASRNQAQPMAR